MCINALCCSGRAVPLFWSALDFAAEFRKIGRNEGDFGGYLPLHLPQSLPLSIKVHFVCLYHNSMSINIKIVQRKDKTSKSNAAPIHIRFTLKGKVRYLATGIVRPLDAWDDSEQHIVSTYPDSDALQMQITAKRLEIEKKIQRLEALDAD